MRRDAKANEVITRIEREVQKINTDGTLPPGARLTPYYDRSELINLTTRTVLHNLIFRIVLVFSIQWMFATR